MDARGDRGIPRVYALLIASGVSLARNATILTTMGNVPDVAAYGNIGHPAAVDYFAAWWKGTPAADFIRALALQKAGQLDQAAEIYARLGSARALNNLGAIRRAQGREADATKLFQEATKADPALAEAAFNLGQPASSPRIERARKYGVASALVATPTRDDWTEAMAGPVDPRTMFTGWIQLFHMLPVVSSTPGPRVAHAGMFDSGLVLTMLHVLGALMGLMAAIALFVRPPGPTEATPTRVSLIGWGLGFVVPGTARQWGVLGSPLLFVCILSGLVSLFLAQGMLATNLFDSIALTAPGTIVSVYGAAEIVQPPMERLMRGIRHLWWVLWIVNLVVVILLERLFPDPLGARGRRAAT